LTKRHDLPYHVIGSDLAGVVLRTGPGVNAWNPGDEVVAHCLSVELESSDGHNDTMLDPEQRIWGFETNFGGLAEIALVKSNQLMPKPDHLSWEEAAAPGLVNSTAYRQLVSRNGAGMKQGDNVLIWGASGGLGSYATQFALAGGATPVCVVSSPEKAEICRNMGAEAVIDRNAEGYKFWKDERTQDPREWKRFGKRIREFTGGEDIDIVFEHPGRETFGASVFVTRKGGTITTCASTSGYMHEYDNRYLWMSLKRIIGSHFANYREAWEANRLIAKGRIHPTLSTTCASTSGYMHEYDNRYLWMSLKRIIGSHFANYREAWEANRLIAKGRIHPTLSKVYSLDETGQAAYDVHRNLHQGKVGVLALAPEEGLGVRNHEMRAQHLDAINRFRNI
ncbi:crotonyl-CoA carboxylase/reductase, partial [Streptomyces sp. CHA15]|uniref:crotonyl-CoA carboxylase/reductase n=1 Tax=Streptomyces sp. CHA15 TaxID=2841668 RepID=UPI002096458B